MKKKGLIISTIVMVVVLIASLTTATYAWFNATSEVKVNDIELAITSNAAVNVGVRTSGARGTTSSYQNYKYETVQSTATDNTLAWGSSGTTGLGSVLQFQALNLSVNSALGTATGTAGNYVVNSTAFEYDTLASRTIVKAEAGTDSLTATTDQGKISVAQANKDYLDAIIGVEANKAGIKGMYVKVEVKTSDSKSILGMNAALHFIIFDEAGKRVDFQPFGDAEYSAPKSAATATAASTAGGTVVYGDPNAEGDGQLTSTFYFWVAQTEAAAGFGRNGSAIHDFEIFAFVEGADADCNNNALGTSCTISISFDGTEDVTKLADGETLVSNVKFLTLTAASVEP